jgi:hypothetical protein
MAIVYDEDGPPQALNINPNLLRRPAVAAQPGAIGLHVRTNYEKVSG